MKIMKTESSSFSYRKSKWDQPATKSTLPALTTTVTGTKGTVISAFGSLPKKPAV